MSMNKHFLGVLGKNGKAVSISTEYPIKELLDISTRNPFDAEAGLDIEQQKGMQRPVLDNRPIEIARVFDDQLKRGYPMENGVVILACTNDADIKIEKFGDNSELVKVQVINPLPAIDRQNTTEAFRKALQNPNDYPTLAAYINDVTNTVCVRIVKDTSQNALRRTLAMNTGQKKWTPIEMLTAMVLDAKHNEVNNIVSHEKERPVLVLFQFAHNIAAKRETHPLFNRLPVDVGKKYEPKKTPTNLAHFLDSMWPLYPILEKEVAGFKEMKIEDQAQEIEKLTLPFWTKLRETMPNSFGDETWYNFNTLRKGMPIIAECFNALIRVWIEFNNKKSTIPIFASIKGKSISEFCDKIIPQFIQDLDPSLPWKREEFWATNDGAFGGMFNGEGEDGCLKYVWSTIKPKGVGDSVWSAFLRTIQGHSSKLRYNERKTALSASETKKRKAAKKQNQQKLAA